MYTVSITSQGQMSIPAKFRRKLGLNLGGKANVSLRDGGLFVRPVKDLLKLAGAFSRYAKKGKNINEVMKMESKAWEKAAVERYKRSLKNSK